MGYLAGKAFHTGQSWSCLAVADAFGSALGNSIVGQLKDNSRQEQLLEKAKQTALSFEEIDSLSDANRNKYYDVRVNNSDLSGGQATSFANNEGFNE